MDETESEAGHIMDETESKAGHIMDETESKAGHIMDETATFLLGAGIFLILVVFVLEVYRTRCIRRESATSSSSLNSNFYQSTVCESKECVRCSKNDEVLMNALTRLSYYSKDSKDNRSSDCATPISSKIDEISIVSSDIKTSMKTLKDQENTISPNHLVAAEKNMDKSNPLVFKCSGIREQKLWSLDDFPALNLLEKNFTQIFLEFIHLYKSPLSETMQFWKTNQASKGMWEIVMLVDQGRRTKASELCPLTMKFIDQIPYFMKDNVFGNASFSVVHPDTEIAAHYGSTNCRIRCHLGNIFFFLMMPAQFLIQKTLEKSFLQYM